MADRQTGRTDRPDPGYDTRIGDDGHKPTARGQSGSVAPDSSTVPRRTALDTNCNLGCGYGKVVGKGKKD